MIWVRQTRLMVRILSRRQRVTEQDRHIVTAIVLPRTRNKLERQALVELP